MKGAGEALRADLRADQRPGVNLDIHAATGLREALRAQLVWLGPDTDQAVESAMTAIEEMR